MITLAAVNRTLICVMTKTDPDPTEIDTLPSKRRSGAKPVMCEITYESISVENVPTESILLYEVYAEEGSCLAEFSSESDFIDYVYASDSDVLEIRLHLEGYVLRGYLYK